MAETTPCQRSDCDQPGKPRTITDPANGEKITLHLCDEDYEAAQAKEGPPLWLTELLKHIGLVG